MGELSLLLMITGIVMVCKRAGQDTSMQVLIADVPTMHACLCAREALFDISPPAAVTSTCFLFCCGTR
eukprot:4670378-Amphidinium_carterae.1